MASHARAGKNAVPPGNASGNPKTSKGGVKLAGASVGSSKPKRGRTAKTTKIDVHAGPEAREGNVWQERQTEVNRAIGRGGGKRRGDRQDTHPDPGIRRKRTNQAAGLRNDRNPTSTAGRRNNKVKNEGG